ncbi:hypothetical protein WKI65_19715 [Streptomyces sp. MS1.AVA.3]|uniref:hypothetical protein n=1 Tax=Streptomyces decoyicus TaxID=249567 RepID=UPI0030BFD3E9
MAHATPTTPAPTASSAVIQESSAPDARSTASALKQKSFTYTPKLKQHKKNGKYYLYATADFKALSGAAMKKICVNIWLTTMSGTKPIQGACTDTIGVGGVTTGSVQCGYALYYATVWAYDKNNKAIGSLARSSQKGPYCP